MISDLECGDTSPLFKARTASFAKAAAAAECPRTPKTLQKIDANKARPGVQKYLKKVKKKLVSPWHHPLNGNLARQIGRVTVQKYFKKSEKKACQPLKNPIIP